MKELNVNQMKEVNGGFNTSGYTENSVRVGAVVNAVKGLGKIIRDGVIYDTIKTALTSGGSGLKSCGGQMDKCGRRIKQK